MPRNRILAIDIGTSSITLLTLDRHLHVGTVHRAPHLPGGAPGALHVADWVASIRRTLHEFHEQEPWAAIAITGQMHGLVPLMDDGYGAGMSWADSSGADLVPAMIRQLGDDLPSRIGGKLAPGFQAVHLEWLKRNRPGDWSRITRAMLPKDALIHTLTGRCVTDPGDAAGTGLFDLKRGSWALDVVDALEIPRDWLPDIVPSGTLVGHITDDAAQRSGIASGIPVIIASGDAPAGAVGAGIGHPGQTLVLLSTGAQIIQPVATYDPDANGRWYTWPSARPASSDIAPWLRVGTLLNSGVAINWLRDVLTANITVSSDTGPTGLITLPWLNGERTPLNDPRARGAILGLTPRTTSGEIARSMLEGIAFSLRLAFEAMHADHPGPNVLTLGGGGANNAVLTQIMTDTLGIPAKLLPSSEVTAHGAALIAADTLGWQSLDQHVHRDDSASTVISPDSKRHREYSDLFEIYKSAVDRVAPVSHRIARWRESHS